MKNQRKTSQILILALFLLLIMPISVSARAGGGSSSGGGGGSGGSSGGSSRGTAGHHSANRGTNPLGSIISSTLFIILSCSGAIVIKVKLIKAKAKTKRKIKKTTWIYKDLEQRVIDSYFTIQDAWAKNDIQLAKDHLTPSLFENFKIKLNWMDYANKRNILKNIKLLKVFPVSMTDDIDDHEDRVWIYIKGKMIDYTINTITNEIIEGSTFSKSFVEYWLFSKNEEEIWVLEKILQANEINKIPLES